MGAEGRGFGWEYMMDLHGSWIRRFIRSIGLDETRCTNCLRPFFRKEFIDTTGCQDDGPAGRRAPLCPECRAHFQPYPGPRCRACGLPMPIPDKDSATDTLCGQCLADPPPWQGLALYGLYRGELRDALLRLKFDGELPLAPLLGACLHEAARCLHRADVIQAMPMHPAHLRRRGYNQAHEIAKALRQFSGIPLRHDLLCKTADRPSQSTLNDNQRHENVRNTFRSVPAAKGLHVWLVDDVMTTGSTLREACKALLAEGAASVSALVVARTPKEK